MLEKVFSLRTLFFLTLAVLFILCIYPFVVMLGKVLYPAPEFSLTFKYFTEILHNDGTTSALLNTLIVSVTVAFISTLISLPLSWLLSRSDIFFREKFRTFFSLPYAIPSYIGAMAWIYLGNPTTGILNTLLGHQIVNIYSMAGLIFVMSCFYYTYIFLNLLASLDRFDPSLEEAARISGAGPFRTFWQITLPIISPALLSGILLVMLAAAACFGVPATIGTPARIYLITTRIYAFQKIGNLNGIYLSAALSFVLMALAGATLWGNHFLLGRGNFKTVGGKSARAALVPLGRWNWPLTLLLLFIFFIIFGLPILAIAISAFTLVPGVWAASNWGWANFITIFTQTAETPTALWNSLFLATTTATVATIIGVILAFIRHKTKITGRTWVELLVALPFATPGTVIAFAFILSFGQSFFGLPFSLYNTLTLMVMAYLAKYLNFSLRTAGDGLGQIDDVLAEAARVSGAGPMKTLTSIWIPLLGPALAASWFLVFLPCFSELTMTILLTGPGLETVGTLIFQLQQYSDGGGGAAVLALSTIIFILIINSVVKFLSKGRYGL